MKDGVVHCDHALQGPVLIDDRETSDFLPGHRIARVLHVVVGGAGIQAPGDRFPNGNIRGDPVVGSRSHANVPVRDHADHLSFPIDHR